MRGFFVRLGMARVVRVSRVEGQKHGAQERRRETNSLQHHVHVFIMVLNETQFVNTTGPSCELASKKLFIDVSEKGGKDGGLTSTQK